MRIPVSLHPILGLAKFANITWREEMNQKLLEIRRRFRKDTSK